MPKNSVQTSITTIKLKMMRLKEKEGGSTVVSSIKPTGEKEGTHTHKKEKVLLVLMIMLDYYYSFSELPCKPHFGFNSSCNASFHNYLHLNIIICWLY